MKTASLASALLVIAFAAPAFAEESPGPTADAVEAALMASAEAKLAISEQFMDTQAWVDSNAAAGFEPPADATAAISIGTGGVITMAFEGGGNVTLTPASPGDGMVHWSCASTGLDPMVVPEVCR